MNELLQSPTVIVVFLSTLALIAGFLVANGIGAWYDERTKRVGAVVRKGGQLRSGFGTFHGVAHNLDARSGGELVRREQTQVSAAAAGGASWQDRACVTTGRPFLLVLESGAEIEVDASAALLLGFPESSQGAYNVGPFEPPRRELVSRLSAGDEVWATGVLARPAEGGGAYRSNLARRKLGAPRRGGIELSKASPVARWSAHAGAHKRGAFAALGAIALLHGVFFRGVDRMVFVKEAVSDQLTPWAMAQLTVPWVAFPALLALVGVALLWFVGVRRARTPRA